MTQQEEIKRFISLYLRGQFTVDEMPEDECDSEAEFILRYLHSEGVERKVERELPKLPEFYNDDIGEAGKMGYIKGRQDLLKAGCSFFEPLIKE